MQETALWERLTSTEDGRNLYRNNLIFNRTVLALQMCRTQTEEVQVLADELVASVKLIDDLNESMVDTISRIDAAMKASRSQCIIRWPGALG